MIPALGGMSLTKRVVTAGLLGTVLVAGCARMTSAAPQTATSKIDAGGEKTKTV